MEIGSVMSKILNSCPLTYVLWHLLSTDSFFVTLLAYVNLIINAIVLVVVVLITVYFGLCVCLFCCSEVKYMQSGLKAVSSAVLIC